MPPSKTTKKAAQSRTRPTVSEHDTAQAIPSQDPAGADAKYTPTAWGSGGDPNGPQDLEVPSGQLCLVRRVGVQGLMAAGVLHNIDRLSAIVGTKVKGNKGKGKGQAEEVDVAKLMSDPKKLAEIMHTVDRVVTHVVVKPEIKMTPNDVTLRVPGEIYADMVDIVDKMFIFNFVVGGTRDLETFRHGLSDAVGGLEFGEDVQGSAE